MVAVLEWALDMTGRVIYWISYVPIYVFWNVGGKYVARAWMNVVTDTDDRDTRRRMLNDLIRGCKTPTELRCRLYTNFLMGAA